MNTELWKRYQRLCTEIESGKISSSTLYIILQERLGAQQCDRMINIRLGESLLRLGDGNTEILNFLIKNFPHHSIATEERKKLRHKEPQKT